MNVKNSKLLAALSVMLVLGLSLVACGPSLTPTPTPTPAPIGEPPLVAIFVDQGTYSELADELEQYKRDIEHDLDAEVKIFSGTYTAYEIREKLQDLREDGLIGSVLVGDIPSFSYRPPLEEGGCPINPCDYPFMDLDDSFQFMDGNTFKLGEESIFGVLSLFADVWVGRIKPPRSGHEGTELLRSYFKRNHEYRVGIRRPAKKAFFLSTVQAEAEELTLYTRDEALRVLGLHEPGEISILTYPDPKPPYDPEPTPQQLEAQVRAKERLEEVLKQDYELIYLHMHGTPNMMICGRLQVELGQAEQQMRRNYFTTEDIEELAPQAYFYYMRSCNVACFNDEGYIAGAFLFYGNGLVVFAASGLSTGTITTGAPRLFPLSLGLTFGDAYKYFNFFTPFSLLGDPTLRIRESPTKVPRVLIRPNQFDFGQFESEESHMARTGLGYVGDYPKEYFLITNTGEGTLFLNPVYSLQLRTRDGQFSSDVAVYLHLPEERFSADFVRCHLFEVEPGEELQLVLTFAPYYKGRYQGTWVLYTNDPDNIVVFLHWRGEGL